MGCHPEVFLKEESMKSHHQILVEWESKTKEVIQKIEELRKLVGTDYESPLIKSVMALSDAYTSACSQIIGDEHGNLEWFAWETDFGEKDLDVKIDGKSIQIRNVGDLLGLIRKTRGGNGG